MRKRTALIVALGAGLLVYGCGSGGSSESSTTSPSSTPTKAGATDAKSLKISVIPKGSTHSFWKSVHEGAEAAGKELGVEILWDAPEKEDDRAKQTDIVENAVTKGVSGIVLAPLDDHALVKPVDDATKAGIPVLIIDSGLSGGTTVSFVATDNEKGGHLAGADMARLLNGKGNIVVLRYSEGSKSTMDREKGFLDEIKKSPGIKVVSADQYAGPTVESAQKASENLLSPLKKGDGLSIDGIYTPNESSTFGMLRVLEDNKWAGKVKFCGFDSSEPLLNALKAGEINSLVVQNPRKMGHDGVATLVAYLRGNKNVDKRVDTGAALITKDNLDKPDIAAMIAPPK